MIRFAYHGKDRLVEPHDHGILNGSVQLLSWQVAGASSRPLPNWLLTKIDEMTGLVLLDQTFAGGRPTGSGKHIHWDELFIRVKSAEDLPAGSFRAAIPASELEDAPPTATEFWPDLFPREITETPPVSPIHGTALRRFAESSPYRCFSSGESAIPLGNRLGGLYRLQVGSPCRLSRDRSH
jgi:hypothetical protein